MFIATDSPPRPSPVGAKCSVSIAFLRSFRAFDPGTINIAALRACPRLEKFARPGKTLTDSSTKSTK